MKILKRKWIIVISAFLLLIVVLYIARIPILRAFGNHLICEDTLKKADVIFVLSGGAFDRGRQAANLQKNGFAPRIVCTGANIPGDFRAMGYNCKESLITYTYIKSQGVDSSKIEVIPLGTSTKEEVDLIVKYCKDHKISNVIIVSTKFHTRRIYSSVRKVFIDNKIKVIINGAPSSNYDENYWWKFEDGLITVNNEYLKLIYYWFKY